MTSPVQYNMFDAGQLGDLKRASKEQSPESAKAVAKQFEALFLQIVMKSMREASPGDGFFDSESTRFYRDMHDQQMAGVLAQRGGFGLAAALEKQLLGQHGGRLPTDAAGAAAQAQETGKGASKRAALPAAAAAPYVAPEMKLKPEGQVRSGNPNAARFVERVLPQAESAAQKLGVPAHFLVGQAALETGWGRHEIRMPDGSPSHNLFNIKAGKGWDGAVVEKQTVEYIDGKAQRRIERFRAYASYEEAFADYARLVGDSPRYAKVAGKQDAASFARALQDAGYATDPRYAGKLAAVIDGTTMRGSMLALASGRTNA